MATYKKIQNWVKTNYGFVPETCWIAHVKELCGLSLRKAPNRKGEERIVPCPSDKVDPIRTVLRFFRMIE